MKSHWLHLGFGCWHTYKEVHWTDSQDSIWIVLWALTCITSCDLRDHFAKCGFCKMWPQIVAFLEFSHFFDFTLWLFWIVAYSMLPKVFLTSEKRKLANAVNVTVHVMLTMMRLIRGTPLTWTRPVCLQCQWLYSYPRVLVSILLPITRWPMWL